jgi:hypothetical protein
MKKKSRKDGRVDQTTNCWYWGLGQCSLEIFGLTAAVSNWCQWRQISELIKKSATLVKVVNIVRLQWPINKRTSNSYINSSNASAFWAIFNRQFARDFKVPTPYSAAASHFVMKPLPVIFCSQVDLQVARQSSLCLVSHI